MFANVRGSFKEFEASIYTTGEDFMTAEIDFWLNPASVYTSDDKRDAHLKSADFFDAANHPTLSFVSTSVLQKGDKDYILKGDLTIRGTTKPIELKVEYGGIQQDFYGNTVVGFEITGKVNRQEYGLQWSAVTEAGGIVVSDDVKLNIDVELIKK